MIAAQQETEIIAFDIAAPYAKGAADDRTPDRTAVAIKCVAIDRAAAARSSAQINWKSVEGEQHRKRSSPPR